MNRFYTSGNLIMRIIAVILTVCILTGCAHIEVVRPEPVGRKKEAIPAGAERPAKKEETITYTPSYMDNIGEADYSDAYSGSTDAEGYEVASDEESGGIGGLIFFTNENLESAYAANGGKFAYEHLTADFKRVYNQMYLALLTMSENVGIDVDDADTINRIFNCVMMDHPEIFWVSGYVYTRYTRGESMEAMGFKGSYTMSKDTVAVRQASINNYVSACLAGMPTGDDYTKIKYIYEYIIKNTDYDTNAVDNQNICSVFINGRSVCQGYSKATQYLCDRAGVMCTLITGTTIQDGNHAWNMVYADGNYYYVDTTWGDANYRTESGETGVIPAISYDYLCVPGYELLKTHTPNSPVELPDCNAIEDNYFVREGAFFSYVDEAGLQALFDSAYEQGMEFVTVKAADYYVYLSLKNYLLEEQNVFRILGRRKSDNTISFWENTDSCTISFKLT